MRRKGPASRFPLGSFRSISQNSSSPPVRVAVMWRAVLLAAVPWLGQVRALDTLPAFIQHRAHLLSSAEQLEWAYLRAVAHNCACKSCKDCEELGTAFARVRAAEVTQQNACRDTGIGQWREHARAAVLAAEAHGYPLPSAQVYEFGVFRGRSVHFLQRLLQPQMLWAFDSFQGLPVSNELKSKGWWRGSYSSDPRAELKQRYGSTIDFVEGYYNESLTESLHVQRGMLPALFVDVDCDLFVSSHQALDWMFDKGLIRPGTLIGYDDWFAVMCTEGIVDKSPLDLGEGRAHAKITAKYNVRFVCVAGPCLDVNAHAWEEAATWPPLKRGSSQCSPHKTWGPIFLVADMGASVAVPDTGYHLTKEQECDHFNRWHGTCPRAAAKCRRALARASGARKRGA